eukprot:5736649-Pyramimonas_sp.AAC.1
MGFPPQRARYSHTILLARLRASPAHPGKPRQSEQGIRTTYYLQGLVPLPPLQGGPARASRALALHTSYK